MKRYGIIYFLLLAVGPVFAQTGSPLHQVITSNSMINRPPLFRTLHKEIGTHIEGVEPGLQAEILYEKMSKVRAYLLDFYDKIKIEVAYIQESPNASNKGQIAITAHIPMPEGKKEDLKINVAISDKVENGTYFIIKTPKDIVDEFEKVFAKKLETKLTQILKALFEKDEIYEAGMAGVALILESEGFAPNFQRSVFDNSIQTVSKILARSVRGLVDDSFQALDGTMREKFGKTFFNIYHERLNDKVQFKENYFWLISVNDISPADWLGFLRGMEAAKTQQDEDILNIKNTIWKALETNVQNRLSEIIGKNNTGEKEKAAIEAKTDVVGELNRLVGEPGLFASLDDPSDLLPEELKKLLEYTTDKIRVRERNHKIIMFVLNKNKKTLILPKPEQVIFEDLASIINSKTEDYKNTARDQLVKMLDKAEYKVTKTLDQLEDVLVSLNTGLAINQGSNDLGGGIHVSLEVEEQFQIGFFTNWVLSGAAQENGIDDDTGTSGGDGTSVGDPPDKDPPGDGENTPDDTAKDKVDTMFITPRESLIGVQARWASKRFQIDGLISTLLSKGSAYGLTDVLEAGVGAAWRFPKITVGVTYFRLWSNKNKMQDKVVEFETYGFNIQIPAPNTPSFSIGLVRKDMDGDGKKESKETVFQVNYPFSLTSK